MTRLTRLALAHRSITVLLTIALVVAGLAAARNLQQELIPAVEFPQATVVLLWPGASAEEVTRSLVEPVESALEGIDDVEVVELASNASESFASVTVRAEYGTSQEVLREAIEQRLDTVDLPDGAEDPEVVLFSFSDLPVLQASIRAEGADADPAALQSLIEASILPEIEGIEGVSEAAATGGREEKVYLTLDTEKMDEAGISVDTIRNLLAANDVSFPAGTLQADGRSIPLLVGRRIRSEDELRDLVLSTGAGGASAGGFAGGMPGGASAAGGRPGAGPASGGRTAAPGAPGPARDTGAPTGDGSAEAPGEAAEAPVGPFPLPAALAPLGLLTTDDLTGDIIRQLERQDPALLRQVADEVIASLPAGAVDALPPDAVAALPEDVRAELMARVGRAGASSPAAEGGAGLDTGRVRVVTVAPGEDLPKLAARLGVDPELIRRSNGLAGDSLVPGSVLRVPLPAAGDDRLPPVWQGLGALRAGDVSPLVLALALENEPDAVASLSPGQLLALPPETVRQLPLPFLARQPEAVRQALLDRMTLIPTPAPTPEAALPGAPGPRLLSPMRQAGDEGEDSSDANAIRLGDIATVSREPEPAETINRSDGQPSLGLIVFKDREANTVSVVEAVLDKLEELQEEPALEGVTVNVVFEQGSFIEESLAGVRNEGLLGAILAIIVILIFLDFSWRATLISAVSIPLSIIVALLLMDLQGLTLNILTLAGLTIAIGRVVDDTIVVIENIYRHIQRGEDRLQAVIEGTREVATAITAATLVAVAVFLPLGLVGGITSEFFLPFALTTAYALLASLVVALTIVPLMADWLLRRRGEGEERETWLQRIYTPTLAFVLDHRFLTLAVAFLLFLGSLALLPFIDRTFLPSFGEPSVTVEMALPPGTDLETTDRVAGRVEAVLGANAEIGTVETTVGRGGQFFGEFAGADAARAFFFAAMAEDEEEQGVLDRWLAESTDPEEVADALRDALRALPDTLAADGLLAAGTPITFTVSAGAAGGPQANRYDLQVRGEDEESLRQANALILAALAEPEHWEDRGYDEVPIINLSSNLSEAREQLSVEVDPAAALARGLTTVQVALALRQAIEGQEVGEVELAGADGADTLAVVVRYPEDGLDSVTALEDYEIQSPSGPVRVGDVARVATGPGPVQISRVDGERAALITGEIRSNDTFGVLDDAQAIVDDLDLDEALGEGEVEVGAGVESRQQREGFRDMLIALPISIIVAYIIMVITFGSLIHPFTILFSLPFAVSGALAALAITGRPISLSSLIGMMMLIGIVTTNAIVLVDLVQQYRERGMDAREALMRGGRTRLRPIVMTAVVTVAALIPLAIGLTEGALIASELATTVIGGLVSSTLLTLVVVPVVYSLLDGLASRGRAPAPLPPEPGRGPEAGPPPGTPQAEPVPVGVDLDETAPREVLDDGLAMP